MRPNRSWISAMAVVSLLAALLALPSTAAAAPRSAPSGTGTWTALGSGVSGGVFQLVRYGNTITVGGNIDFVGGQATPSHVGQWTGSAWLPIGSAASSGTSALTVNSAGVIVRALNQAQIEYWDGLSWTNAFPTPYPNNFVNAMAFDSNDNFYAGGSFTTPASNLAYFNGSAWAGLGTGPGIAVSEIALGTGGDLVVSGYTGVGIKSWNGTTWSTYGGGMTSGNIVAALALDDSLVYAGGGFTSLNNQSFSNIAVGNNGVWSPLGYGLSNPSGQWNYVSDLAYDDTTGLLYVGGNFTFACGDAACSVGHDDTVAVPYIAAWYPARQKWIPLTGAGGGSVNYGVSALAVSADSRSVYAGGSFYAADGISTGNVAQFTWDAPSITAVSPASALQNTAATITLTGQDLETLSSITVDGAAVPYTQVDDATVQLSIPAGTGTRQIRAIAAGGTSAPATFTFLPPPPPLPVAASAPRDVAAVPGNASARVTWTEPAFTGTFPITSYEVTSQPDGRVCLTADRACTIEGLTNGTPYTFSVRALTGAGWSAASSPSDAVTPQATSVVITGSRTGARVSVTGTSTGLEREAVPWVRKRAGAFTPGAPRQITDGSFAWSRRVRTLITVYFTVGTTRSNSIRL